VEPEEQNLFKEAKPRHIPAKKNNCLPYRPKI
jgi:hypothetical protein